MSRKGRPVDPQSVFCEACAKRVAHSEAVMSEGRDHTAYFCSAGCYERWRAIRQHPQRDEPKADSVERDELPTPVRRVSKRTPANGGNR